MYTSLYSLLYNKTRVRRVLYCKNCMQKILEHSRKIQNVREASTENVIRKFLSPETSQPLSSQREAETIFCYLQATPLSYLEDAGTAPHITLSPQRKPQSPDVSQSRLSSTISPNEAAIAMTEKPGPLLLGSLDLNTAIHRRHKAETPLLYLQGKPLSNKESQAFASYYFNDKTETLLSVSPEEAAIFK